MWRIIGHGWTGVSHSAWVAFTLSKALDEEEAG
jgi:hypothetical protein